MTPATQFNHSVNLSYDIYIWISFLFFCSKSSKIASLLCLFRSDSTGWVRWSLKQRVASVLLQVGSKSLQQILSRKTVKQKPQSVHFCLMVTGVQSAATNYQTGISKKMTHCFVRNTTGQSMDKHASSVCRYFLWDI